MCSPCNKKMVPFPYWAIHGFQGVLKHCNCWQTFKRTLNNVIPTSYNLCILTNLWFHFYTCTSYNQIFKIFMTKNILLVVRVWVKSTFFGPYNLWCIWWGLRGDGWTHSLPSFYTSQGNGSLISESKYCFQYLHNIAIVLINFYGNGIPTIWPASPNSVELPRFIRCLIADIWLRGLFEGSIYMVVMIQHC